jgi:protein-tyrosine kinase
MSRIETALNRARAERENAPGVGVVPEGTPDAELFVGPWEVDVEHTGTAPAKPMPPQVEALALSTPESLPPAPPAPSTTLVIAPAPRNWHFREDTVEKLVNAQGLTAAAVEQYRRLAAELHQAQIDRQMKAVMVVSAVPSEGKSLTSLNLALTLSRSYKRKVLLIDADLRRPSLHEMCGLHVERGLQEAVLSPAGSGELAPAYQLTENLALLPAGRPTNDPLGVLTSPRMHAIIAEGRRAFDWVIVDTAPMAALSDATMLKGVVDGALLVVSAGHTPYDLVERAVQTLGRDHILGVVLNGVEAQEIDAAYGYANYYGQSK